MESYGRVSRQTGHTSDTLNEGIVGIPLAPPSDQHPRAFGAAWTLMCTLLWTPLSYLTMYGELSSAREDEDFQRVQVRLQQEWIVFNTLLVAIAAIDATIFAISPDAIFKIRSYTCLAVATSSVASGLGIACAVWFILRYQWVDIQTFIVRSRDVYGSYISFSLSSRVPAFCTLVSSVSLMIFLGLVAFNAWPVGVLALAVVVVFVMCIQFLVYAAHHGAAHVIMGCVLAIDTAQDFLGMAAADEDL